MNLDPRKVQAITNMPPPKSKIEMQLFLGISDYLSKFSPVSAEICKPPAKTNKSKGSMYVEQGVPGFI